MPLTTTHFHSNAPHALGAALAQLVPFSNDLMDTDGFEPGATLPPSASLDSGGISPALSSVQSPHVSFSGVTFIREVSSIFERQMHLGIPQHPPGSVPNPFQQRSTRTFHFEIGPGSPGVPNSYSLGTPSTFSSGGYPMSPTTESLFPNVPTSMSGPMISSGPQTPHLLNNNPMSPGMIPINSTATWGTRRSPSPQPHYLPALSSMPTSSNMSNNHSNAMMPTSFSMGSNTMSSQTPPPIGRTVHIPAPTGKAAYGPPPAAVGGQYGGFMENGGEDKNNAQNFSSNQFRPSPMAMRSLSPNSRPLSGGVVRVRSWGGRGEVGGEHQFMSMGSAASVPATRSEGLLNSNEIMGSGAQTVEGPRRASWSAGMMRPGDAMALAQGGLFDNALPSDPKSADGRGAWDLHYNTAGDVATSRAAQLAQPVSGQQLQNAKPQAEGQHSHHIGPAITTRVRTYYRYVDKDGNPLSEPMPEKPRPEQTAAAAAAAMAGMQSRRAESTNGPSLLGESSSNGQFSVGGGVSTAVGRSRSPAPFGRNAGSGPAQLLSVPSFEDPSGRSVSPAVGRVVNQPSGEMGGNQQRTLSPRPQLGSRSVAEAVPRPQPKAAVVRRVTTTTASN